MKSVMTHRFSQVPKADIPRSQFNRSHGHKTTFDSGYLIPIYLDEALPGDTFNMKFNAFARMETLLKPIMDNIYMDWFFFAGPYRLMWDNWEKFNGEQDNPADSTDFIIPTLTSPPASGYDSLSLSDYFGIPPGIPDLEHSALWHRMYNLTWNQWFRDENLQDSAPFTKDDGPDDPADYTLLRRGKRHDYFTSCLPFAQKGPDVLLPLGAQAPIKMDALGGGTNNIVAFNDQTDTPYTVRHDGISATPVYLSGSQDSGQNLAFADLTNATSATINTIREAFQVQKLYERDARGGTRYTELVLSHFGVSSPDQRLQRVELLATGSTPITVHQVASQSDLQAINPDAPPQANLAAYATASVGGKGFVKSFTEHCLIMGMVSIRADLTYQQGLNRMFSRSTRFDFYWPAFAHLGEQEVLNKEIFAQGSLAATDDDVFGYIPRYDEMRYKPSIITGKFRSTDPQTLDIWHLSQNFTNLPALSAQFIEDNPPIARVIAVQDEPQFIFDSYFDLKCARPMPTYAVPGLVDHF